ncbi:MAG: S8 family peptidase [Bacteroidaceae bacterium]|nr:S8 family peptidase [Bacteroidaceae bacterium]
MKKFSIIVVTLLASASLLMGQSKVSPFTANYLVTNRDKVATRTSLNDEEEVVSAYLHVSDHPNVSLLEDLGVKVTLQLDGILTVRMPLSVIPSLENLSFVKYIQIGTPVTPMLDKARPSAGVDKVHAGEGLTMPYTGKGVVVGIIDGGFDYTHPAFKDDVTGSTRIKRVWEQGSTGGIAPAGFGYGLELTTEESILAAKADVTSQSHGSHVAAIAAGAHRAEGNPYYGIASDADIVLVSKGAITANCANISDAIAYIYNYADSVGKPCVINMSLGWHQGPHDGTSPFDLVADQLQGEGRVLIGSMGNYGNDAVHVSKTFTSIDDSPLKAMASYKIAPSKDKVGGEIDIWGDKDMEFDLQVVVTRTSDGSQLSASEVIPVTAEAGSNTQEFILSGRISGKVIISTEINPINDKPHAFLTLGVESRGMGMTVGIVVTPRSVGTVHAWTDATYTTFETEVPEGWIPGNKERTLCEIGGTGQKIISVGAYVSSNTYTELGSAQLKHTGEEVGALAAFSSVGPTIDGRMKPDVIAPGSIIASAVNSYDSYRTSYPTASSIMWNESSFYYSYMQGTSMAAPFVTGVVATWLQAYPQLDSDAIRSVFQKTATNDAYTNSSTCGYGKIDAYSGLKEVLTMAEGMNECLSDTSLSVFVTRRTSNGLQLCFTHPIGQVVLTLYNASGMCVYHQVLNVTEVGSLYTIESSHLPTGIYILHVNDSAVKVTI